MANKLKNYKEFTPEERTMFQKYCRMINKAYTTKCKKDLDALVAYEQMLRKISLLK